MVTSVTMCSVRNDDWWERDIFSSVIMPDVIFCVHQRNNDWCEPDVVRSAIVTGLNVMWSLT